MVEKGEQAEVELAECECIKRVGKKRRFRVDLMADE
jgi:hypothetical protein